MHHLLLALAVLLAIPIHAAPKILPMPTYDHFVLSQEWQANKCLNSAGGLGINSFVPARFDGAALYSCQDLPMTDADIERAGGDSVLFKWAGCEKGPQNYVIKFAWANEGRCSDLNPTEWLVGAVSAFNGLPVPSVLRRTKDMYVEADELRQVYGAESVALGCAEGALTHIRTCHDRSSFARIPCSREVLSGDSCNGLTKIY
ncbi:hypothetical protein HDU77_006526 [Chytriomyces hyalinus]|nr:hypothetical protein HDU77_006526 [Chytriomyces hyalinus]